MPPNSPINPQDYNSQQTLQPQAVTGAAAGVPAKKGLNKLVIIVIAGVALLLVLMLIVIVSGSGSKNKTAPTEQPADTTQSQSLQPARAIDLEQANNAISQDLSSMDDEKDFPAASLDDKTLGL